MNPKRAKILFIDDQKATVTDFIEHLKSEGFTNVSYLKDVTSLNDVIAQEADVIFLDITGVASALDPTNEGLAVLDYIKSHAYWTQVVVLSGSDFPASKAKMLNKADVCIAKASLTFADLVHITEERVNRALAPEIRNPLVAKMLLEKIDQAQLGWLNKWRLRWALGTLTRHEGDNGFDWYKNVSLIRNLVGGAKDLATLVAFLVT